MIAEERCAVITNRNLILGTLHAAAAAVSGALAAPPLRCWLRAPGLGGREPKPRLDVAALFSADNA